MLVGLLCALLLCVVIGLCVKTNADRHEWQTEISRLKTEGEELEASLTKERKQLEANFTREREQWDGQYNQLKLQHSQLLFTYNITSEEKENLQGRLCKLGTVNYIFTQ